MSCRFSELESLEEAARASPISSPNRRIVAVVGVGHMDGIEKRLASRSRRCFTLRSTC
jgi:pheromone shutdown protein TraB